MYCRQTRRKGLHVNALRWKPTKSIQRVLHQTLLHASTLLYIPFAHKRFYTQIPLQTSSLTFFLTHRHFYPQTLFHKSLLRKYRFNTDAFSHGLLYTHRRFYTQTLSHTNTFTHRRFYTQTHLKRERETEKREREREREREKMKMWRRCEDVKMWRCMWKWEDVKMWRCEGEGRERKRKKMWVCEHVRMWRCEHVKMYSRPPLLEEPFPQTLSGKKHPNAGINISKQQTSIKTHLAGRSAMNASNNTWCQTVVNALISGHLWH